MVPALYCGELQVPPVEELEDDELDDELLDDDELELLEDDDEELELEELLPSQAPSRSHSCQGPEWVSGFWFWVHQLDS